MMPVIVFDQYFYTVFFTPYYATNIGEPILICSHHCSHLNDLTFFSLLGGCSQGSHYLFMFYEDGVLDLGVYFFPVLFYEQSG